MKPSQTRLTPLNSTIKPLQQLYKSLNKPPARSCLCPCRKRSSSKKGASSTSLRLRSGTQDGWEVGICWHFFKKQNISQDSQQIQGLIQTTQNQIRSENDTYDSQTVSKTYDQLPGCLVADLQTNMFSSDAVCLGF